MENAKSTLRTRMKTVLNSISVVDHAANSIRACQRIATTDTWRQARTVLLFAPLPFEIDLTTLAGRGARDGSRHTQGCRCRTGG
jgi:5-formyltetrahydrofolate cyclo-ligase